MENTKPILLQEKIAEIWAIFNFFRIDFGFRSNTYRSYCYKFSSYQRNNRRNKEGTVSTLFRKWDTVLNSSVSLFRCYMARFFELRLIVIQTVFLQTFRLHMSSILDILHISTVGKALRTVISTIFLCK